MDKVTNIKLCGVGGQGILLATELLSMVLLRAGNDVKTSEVHGMAQRGGSVFSDLRFGRKIYSPLIPDGMTDILVGFDMLEAARYAPTLAADGLAIVNDHIIAPLGVSSGQTAMPPDLEARIARWAARVERVDATGIAQQVGNPRTANTALLGALSRHLPVSVESWIEALRERLGAKSLDANRQAFELGRSSHEAAE
jgi:indolepyruvate ferredoxin oxidoreductase beta subunit